MALIPSIFLNILQFSSKQHYSNNLEMEKPSFQNQPQPDDLCKISDRRVKRIENSSRKAENRSQKGLDKKQN